MNNVHSYLAKAVCLLMVSLVSKLGSHFVCTDVQLADKMLTAPGEKIHLNPAYDMWQLGILVYEVMTGQKYWPESMTDDDVLRSMADPTKPLPHVTRPMGLDLVQKVMDKLLHRDPMKRFTSAELIKRLEQDLATAGAVTLNPGDVIEEPDLVIES